MVCPQADVDRILDVHSDGCTVAAAAALGIHVFVHSAPCQVLPHHVLLSIDSALALQTSNFSEYGQATVSKAPDISCCRGRRCGRTGLPLRRPKRRGARVRCCLLPVPLGPLVGVRHLVCVFDGAFLLRRHLDRIKGVFEWFVFDSSRGMGSSWVLVGRWLTGRDLALVGSKQSTFNTCGDWALATSFSAWCPSIPLSQALLISKRPCPCPSPNSNSGILDLRD